MLWTWIEDQRVGLVSRTQTEGGVEVVRHARSPSR
jgi:hypothetical protein